MSSGAATTAHQPAAARRTSFLTLHIKREQQAQASRRRPPVGGVPAEERPDLHEQTTDRVPSWERQKSQARLSFRSRVKVSVIS